MKYTECKWHKGSELPTRNEGYIVIFSSGGFGSRAFNTEKKEWSSPIDIIGIDRKKQDVSFWSEWPTEPTQQDLDLQEYIKFENSCFFECDSKIAFLEGCKSARERIFKSKVA